MKNALYILIVALLCWEIPGQAGNKVFWAGVLADHYWNFGKLYPYAGVSIGGGMETSCYIFEGDKHDWLMAIRKEGLNKPLGPRIYFGVIFAR